MMRGERPLSRRRGSRDLLALIGLLALLAITLAGCSGGRHMTSNTGRAYGAVFRAQMRGKPPAALMSGEDAELAMENLKKQSEYSEIKGGQTRFLMPLQR